MIRVIERTLASRSIVTVSAAISFMIGLVFIFVWAPHPWGWYGIDQYHQIAVELSQGRPFATLDVPWGYAYFLAVFYRLFGPTPLPALLVQNVLNACIPALVYAFARQAFDRRVAAIAAVLVALLSFNTVYVSTEATDSVCTFLFMLLVWTFARARGTGRLAGFAASGVLAGVAAQFRPNLILIPFVLLALNWVLGPRSWRRLQEGLAIVAAAALMLAPWTVRNYRLTDQFMPTSTHGGIQLWYGTLQTGPYLQSRAHNPRSVFATPTFDYTSLIDVPVIVETRLDCAPAEPQSVHLTYRFDAGAQQRVALDPAGDRRFRGAIPAPGYSAVIYYQFEVQWPPGVADPPVRTTPPDAGDAFVYFASSDHVGDLDTADALLDLFDVVRLIRHLAWQEPVRAAGLLDIDRTGSLDERDLRHALEVLLRELDRDGPPTDRLRAVTFSDVDVRATFVDGSALVVPRLWKGQVTDLEIGEGVAEALLGARHRFSAPYPAPRVPLDERCLAAEERTINGPFFRQQPHELRRYTALALDNIERDPAAYAWSVLYRAVRLFVIQGSGDRWTAQQFAGSHAIYIAGTLATATYLLLFVLGAWIAWRRRYALWLPLALIAYVPVTIAFVLTNMRYTITVQPLLLVFVAVAVDAGLARLFAADGASSRGSGPAAA